MDIPINPKIIEKVLLRLIRTEYPSVVGIVVTHGFKSNNSEYLVFVGVDMKDNIRNHCIKFFDYVVSLFPYLNVNHPDRIQLIKMYDPDREWTNR